VLLDDDVAGDGQALAAPLADRAQTIDAGYYGDSILNSLADMGFCALGFTVTSRVPWWASPGIMIAFEIGLALTIRDGLLLNVVMLIYPLDSVLAWQSGRRRDGRSGRSGTDPAVTLVV
jgi:hypothetical protein